MQMNRREYVMDLKVIFDEEAVCVCVCVCDMKKINNNGRIKY